MAENIGDYLLGTIEKIAKRIITSREPCILQGEVTSAEPLKIRIKDGYEIESEHIILDIRCCETWIKIPKNTNDGFTHVHEIDAETELAKTDGILNPGSGGASWTEANGHKHSIKIKTKSALPEICLFRALKKGDKVRVLRLGGGKLHYVLERIETTIFNDSDEDGGIYGNSSSDS